MTGLRPTHALGAAALLGACAGGWLDARMFYAAWLSAWWFCLGLVLGASVNARIHALTGGAWGTALAPAIGALERRLPWVLLLFVPMLTGLSSVYPWLGERAAWLASMDEPALPRAWFSPVFFALRLVGYALVWWWMLRASGSARRGGRAALTLIGYTIVTSLAAVDLVMSLVPGWTSTIFGWLALSGQLTAGAAAAVLLAATQPPPAAAHAEGSPPVWRDLGNLLLTYVLLQAYLQFMQFLIIWAENLPRETRWYLPRLTTGWAGAGVALIVGQFALPLLALLWRPLKDRPERLASVAAGVVAMQALGAAWLIVPSIEPHGYDAWWLLPLAFVGMGLLLFGGLLPRSSRRLDLTHG